LTLKVIFVFKNKKTDYNLATAGQILLQFYREM